MTLVIFLLWKMHNSRKVLPFNIWYVCIVLKWCVGLMLPVKREEQEVCMCALSKTAFGSVATALLNHICKLCLYIQCEHQLRNFSLLLSKPIKVMSWTKRVQSSLLRHLMFHSKDSITHKSHLGPSQLLCMFFFCCMFLSTSIFCCEI